MQTAYHEKIHRTINLGLAKNERLAISLWKHLFTRLVEAKISPKNFVDTLKSVTFDEGSKVFNKDFESNIKEAIKNKDAQSFIDLTRGDVFHNSIEEVLTYGLESVLSKHQINHMDQKLYINAHGLFGSDFIYGVEDSLFLQGPKWDDIGQRFYQRRKVKDLLPDTKVVDDKGEPLIVYHGTDQIGRAHV